MIEQGQPLIILLQVQKQMTDHEQKHEVKNNHEDAHSLQKLVERLVAGENRENSAAQGNTTI